MGSMPATMSGSDRLLHRAPVPAKANYYATVAAELKFRDPVSFA